MYKKQFNTDDTCQDITPASGHVTCDRETANNNIRQHNIVVYNNFNNHYNNYNIYLWLWVSPEELMYATFTFCFGSM